MLAVMLRPLTGAAGTEGGREGGDGISSKNATLKVRGLLSSPDFKTNAPYELTAKSKSNKSL